MATTPPGSPAGGRKRVESDSRLPAGETLIQTLAFGAALAVVVLVGLNRGTSLEICRQSCRRDSLRQATARYQSRRERSFRSDRSAFTSTYRSAQHAAATEIGRAHV